MWERLRHRSGRQQRNGEVNLQTTVQSAQPPTLSEPSNPAPPLAADNSPGVPPDDNAASQQPVDLAKARAVAQELQADDASVAQLAPTRQEALRGLLAEDPTPEQIEQGMAALDVVSAFEAVEKLPEILRAWYRTPSWPASRRWLVDHLSDIPPDGPALLDAAAEQARSAGGDEDGADSLAGHAELLREARRVGVDAAYRAMIGEHAFPISPERQAELQDYLDRWQAESDHGERKGPFAEVRLSGADVRWLVTQFWRSNDGTVPDLHLEGAQLNEAHLEGAHLDFAHLYGATLSSAHLEGAHLPGANLDGATLSGAQLDGANFGSAHLVGANLVGAHLVGAYFRESHLEGAIFARAHLEGANLMMAHLEGANLIEAHLEGANLHLTDLEGAGLIEAHLEGADLREAHLEGKTYTKSDTDLARIRAWHEARTRIETMFSGWPELAEAPDFPATLPPTDMRAVVLDAVTALKDIRLGDAQHGVVRVADVRWGGANLAVIDWTPLIEPEPQLGDERAAGEWKPTPFDPSHKAAWETRATHNQEQAAAKLEVFRAAVRANRQLATALRDQGMGEEADQFAYRAQVLQRQVFWQQHKRGRAIFSWFLDRVAGHGYKPQRSLYTYLLVLGTFTVLYMLASAGILTFGLPPTQLHQLPWYEALVLSVASFHGRGFFQPVQSPGDPVAILAAIEAIFGLFIEVCFIATFTQRFFGK
jgi:uncharacterized protein YjbI with pentapeptide repeats